MALRETVETSETGTLDDAAREDLILTVLARHDPTFEDYRDRLLFLLAPPANDEAGDNDGNDDEAPEEEAGEDDEDSEEDDDDD